MSGPNQHYIPGFLQRAFGIRPRRLSIWRFGRGEAPECRRIKRTGASDYFYSAPLPDGRPTLDDAITEVEQRMASILSGIRAGYPGDSVNAMDAAAVVSHLATRTAHVRTTFRDTVARLLERAEDLFAEPANVEAILGLDAGTPNRLVREAMAEELARLPEIERTGIPKDVLERVGFMLLQESWRDAAGQFGAWAKDLVDAARSRTGAVVSDAHRKGLTEVLRSSAFETTLQAFEWTVESGPPAGAVLPDCVIVAFDVEGNAGNHLFVGAVGMHAVVMAVSPERLLFGRKPAFPFPANLDINEVAVRLSHDFFLAPRNDVETRRLHGLIGADLGPALDESLEGAFDEFQPKPVEATQSELAVHGDARGWKSTLGLDYEVHLEGCGDESTSRTVEELLREFVHALAKALPLDRLDAITVSDDYPRALRSVDQGFDNAPAIETVSAEIGVGIAHTVIVLRSGVVKGHIVLSNTVCAWLVSDDRRMAKWGMHTLVDQLARVALVQMLDDCLPGHLLAPVKGGLTGWLCQVTDGVPHTYVASWTAAAIGDGTEMAIGQRELLANSLNRLRSEASEARREYRGEEDVWKFLDAVMPAIGDVLTFAARLTGHCAAAKVSVLDDEGVLAAALGQAGLGRWFDVYWADLERFRCRLGKWESFEEVLIFNRHVERLLWGTGMALWEDGDRLRFRLVDGDALLGSGVPGSRWKGF